MKHFGNSLSFEEVIEDLKATKEKTTNEKSYFSVEGRLYTLTSNKMEVLNRLFPYDPSGENHYERLEWIENNGKYIGTCENLAY